MYVEHAKTMQEGAEDHVLSMVDPTRNETVRQIRDRGIDLLSDFGEVSRDVESFVTWLNRQGERCSCTWADVFRRYVGCIIASDVAERRHHLLTNLWLAIQETWRHGRNPDSKSDHYRKVCRAFLEATKGAMDAAVGSDPRQAYRAQFVSHIADEEAYYKNLLDDAYKTHILESEVLLGEENDQMNVKDNAIVRTFKGSCKEWARYRLDSTVLPNQKPFLFPKPEWLRSPQDLGKQRADVLSDVESRLVLAIDELLGTDDDTSRRQEVRTAWAAFSQSDSLKYIPPEIANASLLVESLELTRIDHKETGVFFVWVDSEGSCWEVLRVLLDPQLEWDVSDLMDFKTLKNDHGDRKVASLTLRRIDWRFAGLHGLWLRIQCEQRVSKVSRFFENFKKRWHDCTVKCRPEAKSTQRIFEKAVELAEEMANERPDLLGGPCSDNQDVKLELSSLCCSIPDINGVTVVFKTTNDMMDCLKYMENLMQIDNSFALVKVRNRFHSKLKSRDGYRDLQLLVMIEAKGMPMLVEVQIHHDEIYKHKESMHLAYESKRGSFDPPRFSRMWQQAATTFSALLLRNSCAISRLVHGTLQGLRENTKASLVSRVTIVFEVVEEKAVVQAKEHLFVLAAALSQLQVQFDVWFSGSTNVVNKCQVKHVQEPFGADTWLNMVCGTAGAFSGAEDSSLKSSTILCIGGKPHKADKLLVSSNVAKVGWYVIPSYERVNNDNNDKLPIAFYTLHAGQRDTVSGSAASLEKCSAWAFVVKILTQTDPSQDVQDIRHEKRSSVSGVTSSTTCSWDFKTAAKLKHCAFSATLRGSTIKTISIPKLIRFCATGTGDIYESRFKAKRSYVVFVVDAGMGVLLREEWCNALRIVFKAVQDSAVWHSVLAITDTLVSIKETVTPKWQTDEMKKLYDVMYAGGAACSQSQTVLVESIEKGTALLEKVKRADVDVDARLVLLSSGATCWREQPLRDAWARAEGTGFFCMAVAVGPGVTALPLPGAFHICNDQAPSADVLMNALGEGAADGPAMHRTYVEDDACPHCTGSPVAGNVCHSKDCFWCHYSFELADARSTWDVPMTYESSLMDYDPTLPLRDSTLPLDKKARLAMRLGIKVFGAGKGSADDDEAVDEERQSEAPEVAALDARRMKVLLALSAPFDDVLMRLVMKAWSVYLAEEAAERRAEEEAFEQMREQILKTKKKAFDVSPLDARRMKVLLALSAPLDYVLIRLATRAWSIYVAELRAEGQAYWEAEVEAGEHMRWEKEQRCWKRFEKELIDYDFEVYQETVLVELCKDQAQMSELGVELTESSVEGIVPSLHIKAIGKVGIFAEYNQTPCSITKLQKESIQEFRGSDLKVAAQIQVHDKIVEVNRTRGALPMLKKLSEESNLQLIIVRRPPELAPLESWRMQVLLALSARFDDVLLRIVTRAWRVHVEAQAAERRAEEEAFEQMQETIRKKKEEGHARAMQLIAVHENAFNAFFSTCFTQWAALTNKEIATKMAKEPETSDVDALLQMAPTTALEGDEDGAPAQAITEESDGFDPNNFDVNTVRKAARANLMAATQSGALEEILIASKSKSQAQDNDVEREDDTASKDETWGDEF
eukprot:TRINITY_DN3963_c0_g2_i1.p1 TRINITY_DN3963_c0_g2~~TRINITY_DN3963_c0_g2_i1.p1  ORF type:complete len:1643 (-),score=246.66 TRINITY_DN3963_c0_g2_i1:301-5088(-)